MTRHAIITGDIVSSRAIEPAIRTRLYSDMEKFLKSIRKKWIKDFEMFRGDSIQCEAVSPKESLRAAMIIRSYIMAYVPEKMRKKLIALQAKGTQLRGYLNVAFDIRLAIGIGEVDFIKKNKLSSSDGSAFQLSGEGLDNMKDDQRRISLISDSNEITQDIEPLIVLLDALAQKWTQNQAAFVLHKLQHRKDEEIAEIFNISISAVNQRKKNAQWFAIEKAVNYFESKSM